jgi:hypothetical protein
MTQLDVIDAQCEALFASELQQSDVITAAEVADAIRSTDLRLGNGGCVGRMAEEFGEHPDMAAERMRWARQLAGRTLASPLARPRSQQASRVPTTSARRSTVYSPEIANV